MKSIKNVKCKKILVIMLIFIFFYMCVLLKDLQELNENNEFTENLIKESIETNEDTNKVKIGWNYLQSVNKDIIAWIEIEGTNINYPILKDNNLYYLKCIWT